MRKIVNRLSWMIGGPQGSGVDSAATLYARAVAEGGLWLFGNREYHSNIMGKHSYYRVRVAPEPVHSHEDPVQLLAAFEPTTLEIHLAEVGDDGVIVYDSQHQVPVAFAAHRALKVPINYDAILAAVAKETGKDVGRLAILKNTVAVAASLALLEFDFAKIERALKAIFTGRREKVVPVNIAAARQAYQAVPRELIEKCRFRLEAIADNSGRLLLTGNHAVALGKLKAGCRFQTYYPISPATDESVYLESQTNYGPVVVQAEDEIAAICMANGAAVTGVRAATSTSGPGFSLMVEGLGWAGMNEVPVVIVDYQRGGPSTGLPTRTEQGDLQFVIHAGHGDFPRIVLSPGDIEEYFHDTFDAFNYAERYQTPCILLCDKCLANATQTVPVFDESALTIDRGRLVADAELGDNGHYKRFALTAAGVSPRTLPGQPGGVFWMTGDEHNEYGHITEDPQNRLKIHEKRMRKLALPLDDIPPEKQFRLHGDETAAITVVSWGATKGAILDALPVLAGKGIAVNFLQLRLLWPFPARAVTQILRRAGTLVDVEMNQSGQLAALIREQTGIAIPHRVLKWTGRPISETEVVEALEEIAKKKSGKVVLSHGL
ncbi:MAG TPA: 2-oxoacid:acceptor oxidoreductase subunit alpha [Verrucomicrobiae bacterium]|nr:2-oxoacid:acceptor oxidoreductase subunit alpha [Verrucomicrobiae bacterium]